MNYKKRLILYFFIDTLIIVFSIIFSYWMRFDTQIPQEFSRGIPYISILIWVITFGVFFISRLYRRIWQYAGIDELFLIIKSSTLSVFISYIVHILLRFNGLDLIIPKSIFLLSLMSIIIGIGGSRFIWRMTRENYISIQPHHKRALIVGAGKTGTLVAKELKSRPETDLFPICFIDDDVNKIHLEIMGLPVLGDRSKIITQVKKNNIDTIIIAIPSAQKEELIKIINICKETKANIKIVPRVSDVIRGKVNISAIRDVNVEDLLGRDPVEVNIDSIAGYIENKIVIITGAGGSIGSELSRQIAGLSPKCLLLLGHGENSIYNIEMELRKSFPATPIEPIIADVQDQTRLSEIFNYYKPAVVFHAAAHKHVPLMEKNPIEAIKNNVFGTKNVAECAHAHQVEKFVLISTDKAVNPTSVMGATKRIAELIIQDLDKKSVTKFVAVRFGNVLGSRGSVIPLFKKQIIEGGPVTITHPEMVRYFMTIPEASQLVIQAGAFAKGGEIFILDMGEPVKIAKLAEDLIRLSGLSPENDIKIVYSGIRPGEKLFEEIMYSEEGTIKTSHNRIYIGKPYDLSTEELKSVLIEFSDLININTEETTNKIKGLIQRLVPTYINNNKESKESSSISSSFKCLQEEMQSTKLMLAASKSRSE